MKKIGKKEVIFAIPLIQIFLLLTMTPAYMFEVSQTNPDGDYISESNNKFAEKILSLLSKLFTIKQMGFVSATEELTLQCCLKTNNGAVCQDIASGSDSSTHPNSCSDPIPTRCSEVASCNVGTCVYNDGESCADSTPRITCENSGGIWSSKASNEVEECLKGACVLGSEINFITKKQCEIEANSKGIYIDFRPGLTELDFPEILESLGKGACLLGNDNCRFVTANECLTSKGQFVKDSLCTNPDLATNCKPTENTAIFDNKVYFVDTCGNVANIYDSDKVDSEKNKDYWSFVSKDVCELDLESSNSIRSCGNCNVFASSMAVKASDINVNPKYGDYACKDLRCTDNEGNTRLNGERWCEYDGYIGEGKDSVGSEQWITSCNNGEISTNSCGFYRSGVCEQKVIEENGTSFSTAACTVNRALECIDYNRNKDTVSQDCSENSHCELKAVDIDEHFKFNFCAPNYPRGFDLTGNQEDSRVLCSLANVNCTVTYVKGIDGSWECKDNCDCEKKEFTEKMNDLCVSLGDCGSYINYIGKGTNNIQVENTQDINWNEYVKYANKVPGKYVESSGVEGGARQALGLDENFGVFTPGTTDLGALKLGISGFGGVSKAAAYALTKFPATFGFTPGGGATAANTLNAFGWTATGAAIGIFAGKLLADYLGITGPAATTLTLASGVAGGIAGAYFSGAFSQGAALGQYATFGLYAFAIAIIIIIVIVILGWGKTKKVEVRFSCLPWQAPVGGSDCNKCGSDGKPCTKYRCESLGQACRLINENTENPSCESLTPEVNPPVITTGGIDIGVNGTSYNYHFEDGTNGKVSIKGENGQCIQEFLPITFKLKTDEFAQCKWSLNPTATYESMTNYALEGTTYTLDHNFVFEGLSLSLLQESEISGDLINGFLGDLNIYVKCQDYFGNFNLKDYIVSLCLNSGPDETPVIHSLTSINPKKNAILKYGTTETNMTMWINEPAECRYSTEANKPFSQMENSFDCKTNLTDRETFGWPCRTKLTNLNSENTYYIKCSDQPWKSPDEESLRNINSQDFVYKVYVSEKKLVISSAYVDYLGSINSLDLNSDTPKDIGGGGNSFNVKIGLKTVDGSQNGIGLCYYSWNNNYIPFIKTNSAVHSQELTLNSGNYSIPVKCEDSSGDAIFETLKFSLSIDTSPPGVVRAYYDSGSLLLTTNEPAKCYASFDKTKQCAFDPDNADKVMSKIFSTQHSTEWIDGKTYYIKCKDAWDNINPGCGIVVTPSLVV